MPCIRPFSKILLTRSGRVLCVLVAVILSLAPVPAVRAEEPEIALNAGLYVIRAEVARAPVTRARGLMYRKAMPANHGMLFVFAESERQCFWMKNTFIPLSIAFLDDQGEIVNIADMQPRSEDNHCSERPVRYALEMNQGWFAARNIRAGFRISGVEKAPRPH